MEFDSDGCPDQYFPGSGIPREDSMLFGPAAAGMRRGGSTKGRNPLRLQLQRVFSAGSRLGASAPASPASPLSPRPPVSCSTPCSPAHSPLGPQRHSYSAGSLENLRAAARPRSESGLSPPGAPLSVRSGGGGSASGMMSPQQQLKAPRKWQSPVRFRPAPDRGMDSGYLGFLRVWRLAGLLLHAAC